MESNPPFLLEDFGQRVDLTRRIREVLVNYPEGTTVLKELIQNADDAGATKVCLCLDRRVHGVETVLSDKLAEWQGPSLLAFNDAEFTEDDFASISRIGGSQKHSQAWKTGRFGVGFNSVYHMTDLPSFVSGKYIVLFDPQGVYLPNVSAANPGKRIDYVSSSALSIYKDQFFPYCVFGCDMKKSFPGTLFRFPLRNADQAAVSKLSRQAYSEDDISSMFVQLYEEGVFTLLFLKSILSVEMYVWNADAPSPHKLYSCSVSSKNEDTVWHRQTLSRLSNSFNSVNNEVDSFSLDFLSESNAGQQLEKKECTFFIVQAMASKSSRIGDFAATAAKDYDIHLLPWASVAACTSDGVSEVDFLKHGRAFCFLPLPLRTGLSVQVNGYFEVSSNRRSIWYGADMDRGGKLRSDWNRLLLEDVVAPVFIRLLLGVRDLVSSSEWYHSLWPTGSFEEPWNFLVERIYRSLGNSPVLHSDLDGGKWVSPTEAFVHDEQFTKSKELSETLLLLGIPVIHFPSFLINMFLSYDSSFQQRLVSPAKIRTFLRQCETLTTLSGFCKLILLEYCLQDLIDTDVGKYAYGLPLIPLASGEFGYFSEASQGISYYVCSELEHRLLHKMSNRIVDINIPPNILRRLLAITEASGANIVVFSVHCLLQLFPAFVPASWRYERRVLWDPESNVSHPASSWFLIFWQYLRDKHEAVSLFGDWPILPSTSGHLYAPSNNTKLVNTERLPNTMKGLLVKIGCRVLDPKYGIQHLDLSQYLYSANGASVLDAIFDVFSPNEDVLQTISHIEVHEKVELRQFLLDPKWYVGDSVTNFQIRNCKRLPIFEVYSNASTCTHFSDLEHARKYLPPLNVPECLLGGQFIKSSCTTEEEILLRYYGIERMGKVCFYKKQVLNRVHVLQPEVRDSVMLSILCDLPQLCVEDVSLRETLRKLEFVPTGDGSLKCPQVLYDPRNEELYALLEDSDSFPSGLFQESAVLDMLQGLGIRTAVSPETVVQSARQIELIGHKDQLKAHSRGKVLLSYLEVNANKWMSKLPIGGLRMMSRTISQVATGFKLQTLGSDPEKLWNDLRMISWCPVIVQAPYPSLPWPIVSSMVAPPKLVRLQTDLWLVSASMRILDGECSSTALSIILGWSSPPGGNVIASQLLELGRNNEIVTDQILRKELALAMPRMYSILTAMIGSEDMEIVKLILEGCRWIWVGDGFATASEVVLNGPLHLAPYIRVIPVDLAVFRSLFLELGIRDVLKPTDYASILSTMAKRKGTTPLDSLELRAVLLIVQQLTEGHFQDQQVPIYLPDVSSKLSPSTRLVYNDAPWLLDSEDPECAFENIPSVPLSSKGTTHKLVHGNISKDVAEKLGVCSLRRILLAESADSMNLSLSGAVEAFGQHEALTTRLKHIVEMYADGPGILFELVQNAEDAGASEVIFLLDKTHYGTSSVLSPEMADWQGPALYCFNSSIFSPQDLYAISRIGQDSKLDKPFAIGRFGLGFNCVYHFTDIPSFVSGENIVIFDPHASNLPGISPSHPGLRIKFVKRKILEQFPDQFSSYLHFGCDLHQPFPGTLFRFPLRSESAASKSLIKREKYTPEDVLSLFSSFLEVVSETLLFLRNVKTISIYVKDGNGRDMNLLHRVQRHHATDLESESHHLNSMLNYIHGNHQQSGMDKDQFLNKLSQTPDRDLAWNCKKIMVTEQDHCGVKSHFWMVSECLGGGCTSKNSLSLEIKSHKLIPWACVAAYLHTVKESGDKTTEGEPSSEPSSVTADALVVPLDSLQYRRDFEGRAFSFLPLPISTGLPLHVNAYFELSSNRRDIWFGNDMAGVGKARSDWNIHLLENVTAPAYGHLLEKAAIEVGPSDLFSTFWPTVVEIEPWASMVRKLYMSIADLGLRVFYTKARGGQWISTKHAVFPDFRFLKVSELVEVLSDAGLPLVNVSISVVERFMEVRPSLYFLTPQLLRTLLIRRKRGFKNKSAMILTLEYCLSDINEPVCSDSLYGLPLVPLANGSFATFNKRGEGERVFITRENEYDLLKGSISNLLIDRSIPEELQKKMFDIAHCGDSNISSLTCHMLEELFPRILPPGWKNCKQVSWTPGFQGQPSLDWIGLLWSYLRSSCDDLSIFSKWPILPVGNNTLLQLVRNSYVIRDEGWSENMLSLLQKLGCLFLRFEFRIEHPQLKYFVQEPSVIGILNALRGVSGEAQCIERLFVNASEGELHELRSYILQSKWFVEGQMDGAHIDMIKQLPIFESCESRNLVSLSQPTKWISPVDVNKDLLDKAFVRTESEKEKFILRNYLGIREPTRAEFFKDHMLHRMPQFISQPNALAAVFSDMMFLIKEDTSIKSLLSKCPFVLAVDGTWQHPSRLYDPRVPGLQKLLHKGTFFPSDKFVEAEILDALVTLGLKNSLGLSGLLDSARSVSLLHDSGDSEATIYGRRLLACLDALGCDLSKGKRENHKELGNTQFVQTDTDLGSSDAEYAESSITGEENCHKWDIEIFHCLGDVIQHELDETFWSEMKTITWCPVYVEPPLQALPWLIPKKLLASPAIVRPKSQMWIVSSMMHILDGECCSMYLQRKLGWMECPNVDVLSTQLIELSKSYNQLKLQTLEESVVNDALQREIPELYCKMQGFIGTDSFTILKSALDGASWVWIGDNFVSPNSLAFDSPVKFHPYLYVVPSELSEFKDLLLALGVKLTFDTRDYVRVLQLLNRDIKGLALSHEQLDFVHCVLEAVADCYTDKPLNDASSSPLLLPDSCGVLMCAEDLVYNDAPWMENNNFGARHFVHQSINNDLADRLGVQSVRCLSLVDEEMTKNLPCMDYGSIKELHALYGGSDYLLFDLLELADSCKAKKLHLIFDKREHPRQSLLQHNLGEFQGPALVAVLEGGTLSQEEISSLQRRPPWRLHGNTLNYGLGLLSCYFVCDLPMILSKGYFYMFDPLGKAFTPQAASGKMFSLAGSHLVERFHDQFNPMLISQNMSWSSSDSTVIRMPLTSECMIDQIDYGPKRIKEIFDQFVNRASASLLFLKSVFQVSLSIWEQEDIRPCQYHSVCVDPSSAMLRNPFPEKKWRKFHISRLFSSSSAAIKIHSIDVHMVQRGTTVVDKWLVVLSLGSGQTRNMALDRRYLSYNLTPVAGVAAHISRNGEIVNSHLSSCILSPLPLSGDLSIPVTALGCFLVRHNGGRQLFNIQNCTVLAEPQLDTENLLIEAWNRELMSCICDSYVELVLVMQDPARIMSLTSSSESGSVHAVSHILQAYGDQTYIFWPRSIIKSISTNLPNSDSNKPCLLKEFEEEWECLIKQVIRPFYTRLVDLPVWQLYSGKLEKTEKGMFLAQHGTGVSDTLPPLAVCSFIKEHYPVFSVPWELVKEIQAVGVAVREIKPKMVRDLLKASSTSIAPQEVATYIDILDYCLSDIELHSNSGADASVEQHSNDSMNRTNMEEGSSSTGASSSNSQGGDALEMMSSFGKVLLDFGRVVVEDIGRAGGPSIPRNAGTSNNIRARNHNLKFQTIATELKGLLCPTATSKLARLGVTELWVGSKEQQTLMHPLAGKFIHPKCLERSNLADIFSNQSIQISLKLQSFSYYLLANHMKYLFSEHWVNHVIGSNKAPWFSWENSLSSSGEGGPSPEWIRLFWRNFNVSSGDLSLFSNWPLIPAILGRPVLCRVQEYRLVFIPPHISNRTLRNETSESINEEYDLPGSLETGDSRSELIQSYLSAFEDMKLRYPWLSSLLNQCNIPVFDTSFLECATPCNCFPSPGQSLGQVIASKLHAAKHAGYFSEPDFPVAASRDELFDLFASDFASNGSAYKTEEFDMLRALPIYRTVMGTYTRLLGREQCIISPNSFFQPIDERCLSYSANSGGHQLFRALGVIELHDKEVLVKFALPAFEQKSRDEQEDILIYLYMNWQELQVDSTVLSSLKETKFVKSSNELLKEFFKPKDLLDPSDSLLTSVFSEEKNKFPGERFDSNEWLHILRKAGLRTAAEANVILECAKKVEYLGVEYMNRVEDPDDFEANSNRQHEISPEIWSLAVSVVESIFSNFAIFYGNNFCDVLSKIAFIPAEKGLPNVVGRKRGKRILCSYNEAILLKDWPLAWGIAPILSSQNIVPPEYSWGALHLRSPPAFSTVLKHLQVVGLNGGEDTLAHWPISSGMMTIEEASCEVLSYLDKMWGSLSSS
ncbi:Sacsin, partial [Thalictrum thalictroides]